MTQAALNPLFCSDYSRQAGEPMIGSATQTIHYLLLEYNGAWGAKALEESDLPAAVKQHAGGFAKASRTAKTFLIHRPQNEGSGKLQVFLASVEDGAQAIFAFELERYEQLLELDFGEILVNPDRYRDHRLEEPLFLVCVNGRRDICCARRGSKVYNMLSEAGKVAKMPLVWQSTHQGGHRFAANLTILPFGLLYGRVNDDCAPEILEATRKREIFLPNLRGRTAYPPPAQAAEQFLRHKTGRMGVEDYRLTEIREIMEAEWNITFESSSEGELFRLEVKTERTGEEVYDSCKLDKLVKLTRYEVRLVEMEK